MRSSFVINGKFLTGPATGVQRVASEMIKAIDLILPSSARYEQYNVSLLIPRNAPTPLKLQTIKTVQAGSFSGIPWEQFNLPSLAEGRLIVNLANLGPMRATNAITMIHDAQTFSTPSSYPAGFRAWYHLVQPILGKRNKRILTVSEFSRQQLVNYGVAAADKIDVIHNGVDHMTRVPSDNTVVSRVGLRARKFAIALANVQPHKNIKVVLEAFRDPRLADVDLVLFGSATAPQLAEYFGRSLPPNAQVVGRISDSELRGLLEQALCLLFPSKTEGFGLPPLEAMFVGCPVIVAPCGALPEVCGNAAAYADADDAKDWADRILTFADDPEGWRQASQSGKMHAGAFTWERSADRLLAIIADHL